MNIKEHDNMFKGMMSVDAHAKSKGEIVGRVVRESIADGYAYYVVESVTGNMAQVRHVPYLDGYKVPMIESMDGLIPLKYVKENIDARDRWEKMFADARKR